MSGGGGKVDPYYQRDPPKKETRPTPRKPFDLKKNSGRVELGPIRVLRVDEYTAKHVFGGRGSRKLYWYRCDYCGEAFPSRGIKYTRNVTCSRQCAHALMGRLYLGRKHRPESIEKMRRAQRQSWQDERTARNRREAAKTRKPRSASTYNKGWRKYRTYVCSHCGKLFAVHRKKDLENKYCSRECLTNSQRKGEWRKCDNPDCGNEIWLGPSRLKASPRHYCSTKCLHSDPYQKQIQSESKMGERNPNWKGGVPSGSTWEGRSAEMRERDKNACRGCGKRHTTGIEFPVHHIVPREVGGPDEPWNLLTLCPRCHHRADSQGGEIRIPKDPDGNPVVDRDWIQRLWDEFRNSKGSSGKLDEHDGEQIPK